MTPIKFTDFKERIIQGLKDKNLPIHCGSCGSGEMTLIDGFVNQPLQDTFSGGLIIGGKSLPLIALVCNKCGHVQYYALKAIIQDLDL